MLTILGTILGEITGPLMFIIYIENKGIINGLVEGLL